MNKKQLIKLDEKLGHIWFDNISISGEIFGEGRVNGFIDGQMDLINECRELVKGEIERKERLRKVKSKSGIKLIR